MPEKTKSVARTALIVALIASFSKVIGFLREVVVAYVFGVGMVTDAYAVASRVVATAALLVSTYLAVTFVPTYVSVREKYGDEKALSVSNDALGLAFVINIAMFAILQLAAPFILEITGFDAEQSSFALLAIRISLFQLPIMAFTSFSTGYLTARQSFFGPNLIGIPLSVVIITVCLLAGTDSGIIGISVANLLGAAAQILVFFIWLPKEKYRFGFSFKFNTPEIRENIKLLIPALLGGALYDLNAWVDTLIATHLGEGSAAAIGFASRLITFVQGLVIIPIAGMVYSYISEHSAKGETEKMYAMLWKTIRIILLLVFPIIAIAVPNSKDIVRIVYERGAFTLDASVLTSTALMWYLPGLLGLAVHIFLVRFFFVLRDTKTPMIYGVVSVSINIALSITLSGFMGIAGLTLATSIGNALSASLLLIALRRKAGPLGFGKTAVDILKMLVCTGPCVLAVLSARYVLVESNTILRFAASSCAGGGAYLATALIVKETELLDAIKMLKERIKKR